MAVFLLPPYFAVRLDLGIFYAAFVVWSTWIEWWW